MQRCSCTGITLIKFVQSLSGLQVQRSCHNVARAGRLVLSGRRQISSNRDSLRLARFDTTQLAVRAIYSDSTGRSRRTFSSSARTLKHGPRAARPDAASTTTSAPPRSRAENRAARKIRRMQAGTWQPKTQARLIEGHVEDKQLLKTRKRRRIEKSSVEGRETAVAESKKEKTSMSRTRSGASRSRTTARPKPSFEEQTVKEILKQAEQPRAVKQRRTKPVLPEELEDIDADGDEVPRKTGKPDWAVQKEALKKKFDGAAWAPRKRVSPDALNGIRALHTSDPQTYSTPVLAQHFRISPEAVRRILKSKWQPKEEEIIDRRRRWEARGVVNRREIRELKQRSRTAREIRSILNPRFEPGLRHPREVRQPAKTKINREPAKTKINREPAKNKIIREPAKTKDSRQSQSSRRPARSSAARRQRA